jgi:hypothetical protein
MGLSRGGRTGAVFIEPMECLAVAKLPDGPEWVYEIKLDGYRALADQNEGQTQSLFQKAEILQPRVPAHRRRLLPTIRAKNPEAIP